MGKIEKNHRQRIVDGSTLLGVFLTLNGLVLALPQLVLWQKRILAICSIYFLLFSLAEFFGWGYKKGGQESTTKENSNPHFAKIIDYSKEPWRTDILVGQKGAKSHGHLALSGAEYWHIEDEKRNVIVENGNIVSNKE